ncbi:type I-E CRISPR-associated protein Cas7/Cse4/CasC [Mycetocola tolaasinivorans]|uniref:Type I-E CRISPR-associated protein Cas7/Cse4/CasC n=1 Tax=Mycetocola tolaasinivorans TaxID=76635 RepID=A0A3L7A4F9_9MICO|nr:type I-E CRISPR-associated protein Cas7/Cse4/CasC [Mycetocola tolaasinivorans]RLP74945.1 type I-E CRISPR-associated protein Cas7/Cse4/CasC [Mycetocola tolaasinivorans]
MTRTIIDISLLQTVPPSNINRDDTGSPKTAIFGGVRRARVSSQAWKRATRLDFAGRLNRDELGERTKRVVEVVTERVLAAEADVDPEAARTVVESIFKAAGIKVTAPKKPENAPAESGYLLFLSNQQSQHLAEVAVAALRSDEPDAVIKAAAPKKILASTHSVDIALFGRMIAEDTSLNVDAAVQVAHAISVHAVNTEFDYFTAVDDVKSSAEGEDNSGAAMIGTVEFNSSTLYRYATVDVDRLLDNLGDVEATRRAVTAFVESFVRSMPTGKQNTFANRTLPEGVVISVRDSQGINLVGAFERPIEQDRVAGSSAALRDYSIEVDANYGTAPVISWVVQTGAATEPLRELGTKSSLDEAIVALGDVVAERIAGV